MLEAASAYIEQGNYVLTIERERGKFKGFRSMPHGMVEPGNTPLETAIKETGEEAGYKVRVIKQIADYFGKLQSGEEVKIYIYQCDIIEKIGESTMNLQWIPKEELLKREDVVPTLKKAINSISDLF
jgi:8-oxo-dGTP pyrophosphatase MutT (NUDIX family)